MDNFPPPMDPPLFALIILSLFPYVTYFRTKTDHERP